MIHSILIVRSTGLEEPLGVLDIADHYATLTPSPADGGQAIIDYNAAFAGTFSVEYSVDAGVTWTAWSAVAAVAVVAGAAGQVAMSVPRMYPGAGVSGLTRVKIHCTTGGTVTVGWQISDEGAVADGTIEADDLTDEARTPAAATVTPAMLDAASYFVYEQDFPLAAGGTLPAPLAKDGQTAGSTGDYVADAASGVYSLATDVTSEAQAIQLTFGNQLVIDPTKGPVFEARVRLNIPGATITADERWVVGLVSDHTNAEDSLDNATSNVWFRGEGANLNIFVEGDDGTTDTNDQDSTIDYADNTWMLLKIDLTDLSAVEFSINGVAVATVSVPLLSASTPLQPIFCYQRDAGTEINLLQVDWFRVYQER